MHGVPERPHSRLLEGLSKRRMRMYRSLDIFQPGAHLQRQTKGGREFGDVEPDRLNAEDQMIVRARDDASSPSLVIARPLAVNGNRPTTISIPLRRA
jgi:hypothetical protein